MALSTPSAQVESTRSLGDLAEELKIMILGYVMRVDVPVEISVRCIPRRLSTRHSSALALLLVNKQFHRLASEIFWKQNMFAISPHNEPSFRLDMSRRLTPLNAPWITRLHFKIELDVLALHYTQYLPTSAIARHTLRDIAWEGILRPIDEQNHRTIPALRATQWQEHLTGLKELTIKVDFFRCPLRRARNALIKMPEYAMIGLRPEILNIVVNHRALRAHSGQPCREHCTTLIQETFPRLVKLKGDDNDEDEDSSEDASSEDPSSESSLEDSSSSEEEEDDDEDDDEDED